ncbi:hypothetical protein NKH74_30395 [Mesorhizobium sp. M0933]|uniref:hypothetical protein n=1 Tax=Mesorhizobium sp. M0933 TaxID=2957030 RepID=UPI00333A463F
MTIQPIDIPSILSALAWPAAVIVALLVFRHSTGDIARIASERITKVSFAGFGVEFATLRNVTPSTLEVDLRQMQAGPAAQSGSDNVSKLVGDLLSGDPRGYVVIDLGSNENPQWLTSRVYLFAYLITLIDSSIVIVFVETSNGTRQRYIGVASPDDVRWAFARRYEWLESAMAGAYASLAYSTFKPSADPITQANSKPIGPSIDPATGRIPAYQVSQLIVAFLANVQEPVQQNAPADRTRDWESLGDGRAEYAAWVSADRLERRLGGELSRACVVIPPNQNLDDLGPAVLRQEGHYIGVLDSERRFQGLLDRHAILDRLARDYSKQIRP